MCLTLSWWGPCPRPTMNLDGLEMVAVLVVLALFVKVLEQFGLFEPVSLEGNPGVWACLGCWPERHWGGAYSDFMTGVRGEHVSDGTGHPGEVRRGAWGTGHLREVKREIQGVGGGKSV